MKRKVKIGKKVSRGYLPRMVVWARARGEAQRAATSSRWAAAQVVAAPGMAKEGRPGHNTGNNVRVSVSVCVVCLTALMRDSFLHLSLP